MLRHKETNISSKQLRWVYRSSYGPKLGLWVDRGTNGGQWVAKIAVRPDGSEFDRRGQPHRYLLTWIDPDELNFQNADITEKEQEVIRSESLAYLIKTAEWVAYCTFLQDQI